MVETYNYICIKEILNKVLRHPLMKSLNLEDAIYYTLDFIRGMGLPNVYVDKNENLDIKDYRCLLPCDCIKVQQIRDNKTKLMLPYMTATDYKDKSLPAYKIQGNVIYTNFDNGSITVYYSAIKVDDDGLPMLPDTPVFIKALESYIKKEYFTVLFDCGNINLNVLQNAQNDWSFNAGHCRAYFTLPSEDEMEMIGNVMKRMIPEKNEKYTGFKDTHIKEVIKTHSPNN
jgi:hypothetical protein